MFEVESRSNIGGTAILADLQVVALKKLLEASLSIVKSDVPRRYFLSFALPCVIQACLDVFSKASGEVAQLALLLPCRCNMCMADDNQRESLVWQQLILLMYSMVD